MQDKEMLCFDASKNEITEYFEYELTSVPPSLFDLPHLWKRTKLSFLNAFSLQKETLFLLSDPFYVINGGKSSSLYSF